MVLRMLLAAYISAIMALLPLREAAAAAEQDDGSSLSYVTKAWEALRAGDVDGVRAYTEKCVKRYGIRARQMQEGLNDYVMGEGSKIRRYWALNDVATALFIRGKAYQEAGMYDEAKKTYQELIDTYKFGQCWDPRGWFWKPAQVAEDNLEMIAKGVFLDFGDYSSSILITRAWEALERNDFEQAVGYADKCIAMYQDKAGDMQDSLTDIPQGEPKDIHSYWALNDVATAHFIKGQSLMSAGKSDEAVEEFQMIRQKYPFGQCWDPRGWFWKPADAAKNWIEVIDEKKKTEQFLFKI